MEFSEKKFPIGEKNAVITNDPGQERVFSDFSADEIKFAQEYSKSTEMQDSDLFISEEREIEKSKIAKEKEKTEIKLLENFFEKYNIHAEKDKASLALVYFKKRSAATGIFDFSVQKDEKGNYLNNIEKEKKYIQEFMEKLGLKADILDRVIYISDTRDPLVKCDFYVGKDYAKMICLRDALKNKDRIDHKKAGLALSFPESAVEAYCIHRQKIKKDDHAKDIIFNKNTKEWEINKRQSRTELLIDNIQNSMDLSDTEKKEYLELIMFSPFVPSEDNWKEELNVVKDWMDTIKKKMPGLCEEIIKEDKRIKIKNK